MRIYSSRMAKNAKYTQTNSRTMESKSNQVRTNSTKMGAGRTTY